jgi:cysteine desulfurase family protein
MTDSARIYLDNAATSWPKPQSVYAAVDRALREVGAPAGRGVYREADEAARLVADARRRVAAIIGAEEPRRIVFTLNGTDSLNLAIHGLLKPGDHVVTTVVEHNSVLRPLRRLEETGDVSVTRIGCDAEGLVDPKAISKAMTRETRLIALTHASNVTGALQPVEDVGRIAREREILFLVDAAQSVGRVPLDVRRIGCSLLAAPGHKGLMGPLGTGFLYIAPGVEEQLAGVRQGGTGTQSEEDRQPDTLPDKYEAGNLNVPALAGLAAGAAWLQEQGLDKVHHQVSELTTRLVAGLRQIEEVQVFGPSDPARRIEVVSIVIAGCQPHEAAVMLDTAHRIQTRPGLHCAPLMHRALGTIEAGGTLRFSVGPFNTAEEIDQTITAVGEIGATSSEAAI